jgi:hypothetical protein
MFINQRPTVSVKVFANIKALTLTQSSSKTIGFDKSFDQDKMF